MVISVHRTTRNLSASPVSCIIPHEHTFLLVKGVVKMARDTEHKRRRGNGEGSLFQRENGSWCAQITLADGRRLSRHFETQREVNRWRVETLKSQQDGLLPANREITVAQFFERWLEDVAKPSTRIRTYQSYCGLFRVHIQPALGTVKLADLRPEHLQRFYTTKTEAGLSARTVRYLHGLLHHTLDQALKWGLVPRNVCEAVVPPRLARRSMQTLTPAEAQHLLEALRKDRLYALYLLAISTGMRQGEILGLRWTEVDLDGGTVRVVRAIQRIKGQGYVVSDPKTERGRRAIALPKITVTALREHQKQQAAEKATAEAEWQEQGLVFTTHIGTPLDARNILRHFKAALEEAGLPEMRFHDLRHTAATLLLLQEIHPKIVQEMLGHSSITLTLDTYSHVLPDMQREAASKMDALLQPSQDSGQQIARA